MATKKSMNMAAAKGGKGSSEAVRDSYKLATGGHCGCGSNGTAKIPK